MNSIDEELSFLYDEVDILVDDENFTMMNDLLIDIDIESSGVEYLVMALSVTLPYRDKLPFRGKFFDMVHNRMMSEAPIDVDLIMMGLK